MGGSIKLGNITPAAECNIYSDPAAAKIVFASGIQIFLAPLDLTQKVCVDQDILDKIGELKSNFATNVVNGLKYYISSYNSRYGINYAYLHDPVAIYYIINPEAFETKLLNVEIETQSEFCNGRTVVDYFGVTQRKPNTKVGLNIDLEAFWKC